MLPDLSGLAVRDEEPVGMEGSSSSGGGGGGGFAFAPPGKLVSIGPKDDIHGRSRLVRQRSGTGPLTEPLADNTIMLKRSSAARSDAVVKFYNNVDPNALSMSADQKEVAPYNKIVPVGVFDVEYKPRHPIFTQYVRRRVEMHQDAKELMKNGEDWCREYG